jgi:hypothetical protein
MKLFSALTKPFFKSGEASRKRFRAQYRQRDQQWSWIMWVLISSIYRSYCRARLLEMRKYHLASTA